MSRRRSKSVVRASVLIRVIEAIVVAVMKCYSLDVCAASCEFLICASGSRQRAGPRPSDQSVVHIERCEGVCHVAEQQRPPRVYGMTTCKAKPVDQTGKRTAGNMQ